MPDFWKFELENKKEYDPIDMKTGEKQNFDFKGFMKKIEALKTDYALYIGSETEPPCIGKTNE